jgi:uncharacterized membrane protein YvbJ
MPLCPHCGAQIEPTDTFCTSCGRDLEGAKASEDGLSTWAIEEEEPLLEPEEHQQEETPWSISEVLPEAETREWMSPTSQTLWIVTIVVLMMLLCCCGVLGLVALTRALSQGPML